jgi:cytochrome c
VADTGVPEHFFKAGALDIDRKNALLIASFSPQPHRYIIQRKDGFIQVILLRLKVGGPNLPLSSARVSDGITIGLSDPDRVRSKTGSYFSKHDLSIHDNAAEQTPPAISGDFTASPCKGETVYIVVSQMRSLMKSVRHLTALLLLATTATTATAFAQDAKHGRQVYRACLPCHVPDADTNPLGPHLKGVLGRTAGGVEGFRYSQAMRDAGTGGLVWDEKALSEFLSSPKRKVPGTSMRFWGFWTQSEIDDVIAYLKTNR